MRMPDVFASNNSDPPVQVQSSRRFLDETSELGYTVAVLRNPHDRVVRIYGRYPVSKFPEGAGPECQFQLHDTGRTEDVPTSNIPAKVLPYICPSWLQC
jgi:hypothetical protein